MSNELTQAHIAARPEPFPGMRCYMIPGDGQSGGWWTATLSLALKHDNGVGLMFWSIWPLDESAFSWRLPGEPDCPPDPKMQDYEPQVGDELWCTTIGSARLWVRTNLERYCKYRGVWIGSYNEHEGGMQWTTAHLRTHAMLISRVTKSRQIDTSTEVSSPDPEAPYGRNPSEPKVGDRVWVPKRGCDGHPNRERSGIPDPGTWGTVTTAGVPWTMVALDRGADMHSNWELPRSRLANIPWPTADPKAEPTAPDSRVAKPGDRVYWNGQTPVWHTVVDPGGVYLEAWRDGATGAANFALPRDRPLKDDYSPYLWPGEPGCPPDPKASEQAARDGQADGRHAAVETGESPDPAPDECRQCGFSVAYHAPGDRCSCCDAAVLAEETEGDRLYRFFKTPQREWAGEVVVSSIPGPPPEPRSMRLGGPARRELAATGLYPESDEGILLAALEDRARDHGCAPPYRAPYKPTACKRCGAGACMCPRG